MQASKFVRLRLVHSLWERHRKYPDLWVHMLGMTPSQLLNAFPYDSADSSTWLNVVRWGGYSERAMLKAFSDLPRDFQYALGNREQWTKSLIQSSNSMEMHTMANRHWLERVESELGVAAYPTLTKGER